MASADMVAQDPQCLPLFWLRMIRYFLGIRWKDLKTAQAWLELKVSGFFVVLKDSRSKLVYVRQNPKNASTYDIYNVDLQPKDLVSSSSLSPFVEASSVLSRFFSEGGPHLAYTVVQFDLKLSPPPPTEKPQYKEAVAE